MPIVPMAHRRNCGRWCQKMITWLILATDLDRSIHGACRSMRHLSMIGDGLSRCRRISITLRPQQCLIMLVMIRSSGPICIFCKEQCLALGFMVCAPSGGILRFPIGSVMFRAASRKSGTPLSYLPPNERLLPNSRATAGIPSHPAQSATDLRVGDQLDRAGNCILAAQPSCSNHHANRFVREPGIGLAGV